METTILFEVDENILKEATDICNNNGLTLDKAINMFLLATIKNPNKIKEFLNSYKD